MILIWFLIPQVISNCPEHCACCDYYTCYYTQEQCFSDGTPKDPVEFEGEELPFWFRCTMYLVLPCTTFFLCFVVLVLWATSTIKRYKMKRLLIRQGIRTGEGEVIDFRMEEDPSSPNPKELIPIHDIHLNPRPVTPNPVTETKKEKEELDSTQENSQKLKDNEVGIPDSTGSSQKILKTENEEDEEPIREENLENSEIKEEERPDDSIYPINLKGRFQIKQKFILCANVGNGPHNL